MMFCVSASSSILVYHNQHSPGTDCWGAIFLYFLFSFLFTPSFYFPSLFIPLTPLYPLPPPCPHNYCYPCLWILSLFLFFSYKAYGNGCFSDCIINKNAFLLFQLCLQPPIIKTHKSPFSWSLTTNYMSLSIREYEHYAPNYTAH